MSTKMIHAVVDKKPARRTTSGKVTTPGAGRSPGAHKRGRRLTRSAFLTAALLLLAGAWFGLRLVAAWQEAFLREAYLPQLEARARRSTDDRRLLTLLGARLMEAREHAAAAGAFQRAVAAGHLNDNVWLSLAAATAASGDGAGARAHLETGLRTFPDSAALRSASERSRELGAAPAPGALAQAISPRGPALLIPEYTRGSFFNPVFEWWGRRRPEDSGYTTRQRWVAKRPGDAQAQRLWGLALVRNRREPEAGVALRRAVDLAPSSPAARLALADLLADSGRVPQAGLHYMTCLKLRPNWVPALLGLGRTSLRNGLRHAMPCYKLATKADPKSVEAWIGLGRAYLKTDRDEGEAVAAFQQAARLAPDRTDFFLDHARALEASQRAEEAEALLRRRLAAAPDHAEAHYRLAGVLAANQPTPAREAEAEAVAREALRLAPHSPAVKSLLGDLLLRRGEVKEAVGFLEKAHADDPYHVNTMNLLARAYARVGRAQAADDMTKRAAVFFGIQQRISVLESQRRQNPMDLKLAEELADLYARNGQTDRVAAARDLVRQLRTDPKRFAADLKKLKTLITDAGLDA